MMADACTTGERVLAALAEGRRRAIEQQRSLAAPVERAVRLALDIDLLEGHGEWGRASRIARALRGRVEVYHRGAFHRSITANGVKRILKRLTLETRS